MADRLIPEEQSPGTRRGFRVSRLPLVVALVVVVALGAGAVAASGVLESGGTVRHVAPVAGLALELPPTPGVNDLGPAPVPAFGDIVEWTGSQLLMFGGQAAPGEEVNGGATFDPATGEWRSWSPAPFDPALAGGMGGVWTGEELVVVGVLCTNRAQPDDEETQCFPGTLAAASYKPHDDSWTALPAPRVAAKFEKGNSGGIGAGAVGWNGSQAIFDVRGSLVAFRPETGSWVELPPAKDAGSMCVSGSVLVASHFRPEQPDGRNAPVSLDIYTPGARSWEPVPLDSATSLLAWNAICTDDSVVVSDFGLTTIWRLDLASRRWTELSDPPLSVPTHLASSSWTGREVAFWNEGGLAIALDPGANTWRVAEPGPYLDDVSANHVWVSGYALIVGRGVTAYVP